MPYGVVKTSKLAKSVNISFSYNDELENGSLVAKGSILPKDSNVHEALPMVSLADELFLIATPAWDYNTSSVVNQNEDRFINKVNSITRGYRLYPNGRFDLTTYSIDNESNIVKGNYIIGQIGSTRSIAVSSEPDKSVYGFIGKIIDVYEDSFLYYVGQKVDTRMKFAVIEVIQNKVKIPSVPVIIPKPLTGVNITTSVPTPFNVDDEFTVNTNIVPLDADLPINYAWTIGGTDVGAIEIVGTSNANSVVIKGKVVGEAELSVAATNPSNNTGVTDSVIINVV